MIEKVLVADRGEISIRIIRSLKELGIKSVAVYSEADRDALNVLLADEAVCIGPADIKESYLKFSSILSAAEITGAGAIHPGYSPLSENLEFAEACQKSGIVFIGTGVDTMSLMADKIAAKREANRSGIPVVPGSDTALVDDREALSVAESLGFPVILKAVGGGGGRGVKVVPEKVDFLDSFHNAKREAQDYLKNPGIYVEKYLDKARHIEFQIVADMEGNVIHLGHRDCTIQRRYQKIIEESPSPVVERELSEEMGEAAVKFARSVNYSNLGTVEFLVTDGGEYFFSEMNTRIQVEHTVTEMVTGIDVAKWQIMLAFGERLGLSQEDVQYKGHSLECRITAEDPFRFTPSSGVITRYIPPGGPGVRVDSAIFSGAYVNPYYDPLIVKLITLSRDRDGAIKRMSRALSEFHIEGIETTIPLFKKIMKDPEFIDGYRDIRFLNKYI
ncbi:MAG: acetyl-CoA carboxylase biotin carboxylase subunit [Deltaproteobacteria bacterium]|uniref:biotin carboxylase n=1 Tax=Candidatus Zymogenus saltonus TaxID=2844893 RepID=A0A9D8KHN0_9DELT|nr:acetyl-CoA carboxylase biotin carboxylase subunit [Candidatus Zymogenus saltonus]